MWRRTLIRTIQRSRESFRNPRGQMHNQASTLAFGLGIGLIFAVMGRISGETLDRRGTCLDEDIDLRKKYPTLPTYTYEDVQKHTTIDSLWVVVNGCVYDITDFLTTHPGGDRILNAKGASVEPYWQVYPIHYTSPLVQKQLDGMRIGILHEEDRLRLKIQKKALDASSPFANDPARHPLLKILSSTPYNGETPDFANTTLITPNNIAFTRNHHAVPQDLGGEATLTVRIHPSIWLEMQNQGYSLQNNILQKPGQAVVNTKYTMWEDETHGLYCILPIAQLSTLYEPTSVKSTIVCAGNRRAEMSHIEPTDGLSWKGGAASTAVFTGTRLPDILSSIFDITEANAHLYHAQHVIFKARDNPFMISIPVPVALPRAKDVILATCMNDEQISRDHGGELRGIVPGSVGVRNTKWLHEIELSPVEVASTWQTGAPYKIYPQHQKSFKDIDTKIMPSLNEMPVMSVITTDNSLPLISEECEDKILNMLRNQNMTITDDMKVNTTQDIRCVNVQGWAYSGGGTGIVRVDVTSDEGATWVETSIEEGPSKQEIDNNQAWYWTQWIGQVPVQFDSSSEKIQSTIASRAIDARGNVQPQHVKQIWNKRGILNNAWFQRTYDVKKEE